MTLTLPPYRYDISFLEDSITHKGLAGVYAEQDVGCFDANTPALQEAVKYWLMPQESTEETVLEENRLLINYANEIEIIRRHLWEVDMARKLSRRQNQPQTIVNRVFNVIFLIPESTTRNIKGMTLLTAGLACVFFCSK